MTSSFQSGHPPNHPTGGHEASAGVQPATSALRQAVSGKSWHSANDSVTQPSKHIEPQTTQVSERSNSSILPDASQGELRDASPQHSKHASDPPRSDSPPNDGSGVLVREPETRPISQEQLVAEVKGIYAGLVMVESKCIEVDNAQNAQKESPHKLNNEQWQALIALHRTLLHEHHDFFLASQHPSASLALQRLASKYSMPARMWRHGIHSFLELLRHRLPASLEHMLTFIYLAYSMMALLYETVPAFEDTWIECLGDLGRYRMAIEDDNLHDREIWTGVSRHWYSMASDKAPTTGRLYHHLAILARPNALQQLHFYIKSLMVPIPFNSARESVMTLFEPVLGDKPNQLQPIDANLIRLHAVHFTGRSLERFRSSLDAFKDQLDKTIARTTRLWMEPGTYIAISNICALLHYGNPENALWRALKPGSAQDDTPMQGVEPEPQKADPIFDRALELNVETHEIVLSRIGDPSTYPYLHVVLVSLFTFLQTPGTFSLVQQKFPFGLLAEMLNTIASSCESPAGQYQRSDFPGPGPKDTPRPLPEDYSLRGLVWTEKYFPGRWFASSMDADERALEVPSTAAERKVRCLWLAIRIAELAKGDGKHHLGYDAITNTFFAVNAPPKKGSVAINENDGALSALAENPVMSDEGPDSTDASTAEISRTSTWASAAVHRQKDEDMIDSVPTILS